MPVVYSVLCTDCMSDLDFRVSLDNDKDLFVDVDMCVKCLKEQINEGYREGFEQGKSEGYDEGYEKGLVANED